MINSSIQEKWIQHLIFLNDPVTGFEGKVWLFALCQFGGNVIKRRKSIYIFILINPITDI